MLKWTMQSISLQVERWAVNKNWNGAKVTGVWRKPREVGQRDARCCQNNGKETRSARHNLKHQQQMLSSEQRKQWAVVQGHLSGGLERRREKEVSEHRQGYPGSLVSPALQMNLLFKIRHSRRTDTRFSDKSHKLGSLLPEMLGFHSTSLGGHVKPG